MYLLASACPGDGFRGLCTCQYTAGCARKRIRRGRSCFSKSQTEQFRLALEDILGKEGCRPVSFGSVVAGSCHYQQAFPIDVFEFARVSPAEEEEASTYTTQVMGCM
eukprot:1190817-Amphidinium_carterae.1